MTVNTQLLTNRLLVIFTPGSQPQTYADAAAAWSSTLDQYFQQAEDTSGDTPITVNLTGLYDALHSLFVSANGSIGGPTVATAAQAFADGFEAYWSGAVFRVDTPPVTWVSELSSTVTNVVTTPLKSDLEHIFSDLSTHATPESKAAAIALAFQSAVTNDVTVTITGKNNLDQPVSITGKLS